MNYEFPKIEHIDDVREAIEGYPEIVIARRVGFDVVNYVNLTSDTFRPPIVDTKDGSWLFPRHDRIRRECRGLIFDQANGKIIRRPFHKFFNLNERFETMEQYVDLTKAQRLYKKLDGSMIAPFITSDGQFRVGTKMGETEIADQAIPYIHERNLFTAVMNAIEDGVTPIFEWMSPWNTVVIRHSTPKLTLIGLREMVSGRYNNILEENSYGFTNTVDVFQNTAEGQADLISRVRDLVDEEGIVAVFSNGHRAKVKGDWYVAIHKVKDNLLYERNVVALILNDQLDDILPYLDEIDKARLTNYKDVLMDYVWTKSENVAETVWRSKFEHVNMTKKDFALGHVKDVGAFASVAFKLFEMDLAEDHTVWDAMALASVTEFLLKQTTSNSKLAEFKQRAKFPNELLKW